MGFSLDVRTVFEFVVGATFIFSPKNPELTLGSTHHPMQWVPGALSLGQCGYGVVKMTSHSNLSLTVAVLLFHQEIFIDTVFIECVLL